MNHQQMVRPALVGLGILFALGLTGLPVLAFLPLLILVACPLMMILMMAGMNHGGGHHGGGDHGGGDDDAPAAPDRRWGP